MASHTDNTVSSGYLSFANINERELSYETVIAQCGSYQSTRLNNCNSKQILEKQPQVYELQVFYVVAKK